MGRIEMGKPSLGRRHAAGLIVALLGLAGFACCLSAEFTKAEEKDVRLDGNLCSMPKTSAFELGIAAILCLFVAQIIGTSVWSTLVILRQKIVMKDNNKKWKTIVSITLLILSWVTFGLVMILLATASSMNKGQTYGRGWLDGKCYTVKRGIYGGAALMNLVTMFCILGLIFTSSRADISTSPDMQSQNLQEKNIMETVEARVAEA